MWFALNENQPAGTLDRFVVKHPSLGSMPLVCPTLKFSPQLEGGGWFYVLDVPRSNDEGAPEHGDLLELEAGPEFVSTCLRVVRQHGGLVMGDRKMSGGDLARYYACPPIPVTRPFNGCPFIDRDARYLFPGPGDDEVVRSAAAGAADAAAEREWLRLPSVARRLSGDSLRR